MIFLSCEEGKKNHFMSIWEIMAVGTVPSQGAGTERCVVNTRTCHPVHLQ